MSIKCVLLFGTSTWFKRVTLFLFLVALNSSRFTLNSLDSLKSPVTRAICPRSVKTPGRGNPEYLEYTSSLLKKEQIPLLDNVIIPARDLDVGQR